MSTVTRVDTAGWQKKRRHTERMTCWFFTIIEYAIRVPPGQYVYVRKTEFLSVFTVSAPNTTGPGPGVYSAESERNNMRIIKKKIKKLQYRNPAEYYYICQVPPSRPRAVHSVILSSRLGTGGRGGGGGGAVAINTKPLFFSFFYQLLFLLFSFIIIFPYGVCIYVCVCVCLRRGSGKAVAGLSTEPRAGAEHRSQLLSDHLPGTNQTSWQNGHLYPRGRVAEGKLIPQGIPERNRWISSWFSFFLSPSFILGFFCLHPPFFVSRVQNYYYYYHDDDGVSTWRPSVYNTQCVP